LSVETVLFDVIPFVSNESCGYKMPYNTNNNGNYRVEPKVLD